MNPIVLLPLGDVERPLLEESCGLLAETFGGTAVLREVSVDLERFFDAERVQYNSTAIIRHLLERGAPAGKERIHAGDPGEKTLAVVARDLFVPILTYVFGEAQLGGRIAVVSTYRLQNERYGLPRDHALLRQRFRKEAVHELGHTYGLVHCDRQECVMHSSTYVEDIDLKGEKLCRSCAAMLRVEASK